LAAPAAAGFVALFLKFGGGGAMILPRRLPPT
jgi:hypothetical protein